MSKNRRYLKFGYGYNEEIKSKPYYNWQDNKKCYGAWYNMMKRCYDINCINYETYGAIGCTVIKKWHNFQNFAQWWNENYYEVEVEGEVMSLDKDIIREGNKLYSPRTCFIVPLGLNSLFKSHTISYSVLDKKYNEFKEYLPKDLCKRVEMYLCHRRNRSKHR